MPLLNIEKTAFLIVDMQKKLLPVIEHTEEIVARHVWLGQLCQILDIPAVISVHCAEKLGATDERVAEALPFAQTIHKRDFSCVPEGLLKASSIDFSEQIVVSGIESHICVLQTVADLIDQSKQVFVLYDAISSRHVQDKELAVRRMQSMGAEIITSEMLAFELLRTTNHKKFSQIIKELIK